MSYVNLKKQKRCLRIELTPEGRDELLAKREGENWNAGTDSILQDLLEDHLGNGWEWVKPEEIGALTSAPILSDDVKRDGEGKLTEVGHVYWFPDYAVRCELDDLLEKGFVEFPLGE